MLPGDAPWSEGGWPRAALALALAVAAGLGLAGCGGDADDGGPGGGDPAAHGEALFESSGCGSCHSVTGSSSTGPHLDGIYGTAVELSDGESVAVDDAYLEDSIRNPRAEVVDGFDPIMPSLDLSDDEVDALVAYVRSLSG